LIRLKIIDAQWDIVKKLKDFNLNQASDRWKITYTTPTYGGWDLLIECFFKSLKDLENIILFCRTDKDLREWIEATNTLISVRKNFKPSI